MYKDDEKNIPTKTIEDLLVEKIKTEGLDKLVDEQALTILAEKVIYDVLLAPKELEGRYWDTEDSPTVRTIKEGMDPIIRKAAKEIEENEEIQRLVHNTMIDLLPYAILNSINCAMRDNSNITIQNAVGRFQELKQNGY